MLIGAVVSLKHTGADLLNSHPKNLPSLSAFSGFVCLLRIVVFFLISENMLFFFTLHSKKERKKFFSLFDSSKFDSACMIRTTNKSKRTFLNRIFVLCLV